MNASSKGTIVLIGVALGIYALKAVAPSILGGRPLPRLLDGLARFAPAALLAALVVTSTLADGRRIAPDARISGVIVAGLALWRRAGFVTTVVLAVTTTAALRAVF